MSTIRESHRLKNKCDSQTRAAFMIRFPSALKSALEFYISVTSRKNLQNLGHPKIRKLIENPKATRREIGLLYTNYEPR